MAIEGYMRFERVIFVLKNLFPIPLATAYLKVHKIENFFYSDFGICVISLLVMHK